MKAKLPDLAAAFEKFKGQLKAESDPEMTFRPSKDAFDQAIAEGRLSADPKSCIFAGLYMYMGTKNGKDLFKHMSTRQYIS